MILPAIIIGCLIAAVPAGFMLYAVVDIIRAWIRQHR